MMVKGNIFIKEDTQKLKGLWFLFDMVIMDKFKFSDEVGIILIGFIFVIKEQYSYWIILVSLYSIK